MLPVEAEQKQRLSTHEEVSDQGPHLFSRKRSEPSVHPFRLPSDIRNQIEPSSEEPARRGADLGIRPPGGDHLLQHPDVARVEIVLQVVTGLLVALPQRRRLLVQAGLPVQSAPVLLLEQGEDQPLLRAEVVVDLAEGDPGSIRDLAGGQPRVPLGQQLLSRGLEDR